MKYVLPAYLFFIFLVSCENKSDNNEQLAAPSVSQTTNPIFPVSNDSLAKSNSDAGVVLNPQHGQPGHRCDIAVGAPLNTPVPNSSVQPISIQPTATPTTTPTTTSTVAPTVAPTITPTNEIKKAAPVSNTATANLNPKHGEPGHRCDIAVGAPLTSKPNQ